MRTRNGLAAARAGALLMAGTLSACSPDAAQPEPTHTTYDIGAADLTATEPNDICRTRHPAFLRDLLLRISAGLPPGSSGFEFIHFTVDKPKLNGEWAAMVRFRAALPGEPVQTMRTVAPFNPEDCTTGAWSLYRREGAYEK